MVVDSEGETLNAVTRKLKRTQYKRESVENGFILRSKGIRDVRDTVILRGTMFAVKGKSDRLKHGSSWQKITFSSLYLFQSSI